MSDWLERHTARAPAVLRAAVLRHVEAVPPDESLAVQLARAGGRALARVTSQAEGGREVALDLLAADALITLALLAQAEMAPGELEEFAAGLLSDPVAAG